LENSTHGAVIETLDLLRSKRWSRDAFIMGDITLKIEHCLVVAEQANVLKQEGEESQDLLEDIAIVYSHEQALGQCAGWLDKNLPHAKRIKVESTAQAAKQISEGNQDPKNRAAAICSEICVQTYPRLQLGKKGIQDRDGMPILHLHPSCWALNDW
jgi:prephenate dehydratase